MEHVALYRLYRPMNFDEIVEQSHAVAALRQSVISGKIGHAYLFCGTRGTGKTSIAKVFSRAINCLHPVNGNPCNECEICKGVIDGSLLDVIEMDAASNNSVDNIRRICDEVMFMPSKAKYKVYIIDEVHMLSTGAFNALLKTLEEPPAHAVFLLATTEPHRIPATILSRCQRYDFRRISNESIIERLDYISKKQNISIEKDALAAIATLGDGALRDSVSLLDQVSTTSDGKVITRDDILRITGVVDEAFLNRFATALLEGRAADLLPLCRELTMDGRDLIRFTLDLAQYFRNILVTQVSSAPQTLIESTSAAIADMTALGRRTDSTTLLFFISRLSDLTSELKWSPSMRTSFEIMMLRLASRGNKIVPPVVPPQASPAPAAASATPAASAAPAPAVPAPEAAAPKASEPAPASETAPAVSEPAKTETPPIAAAPSSDSSAPAKATAPTPAPTPAPAAKIVSGEVPMPASTSRPDPSGKPEEPEKSAVKVPLAMDTKSRSDDTLPLLSTLPPPPVIDSIPVPAKASEDMPLPPPPIMDDIPLPPPPVADTVPAAAVPAMEEIPLPPAPPEMDLTPPPMPDMDFMPPPPIAEDMAPSEGPVDIPVPSGPEVPDASELARTAPASPNLHKAFASKHVTEGQVTNLAKATQIPDVRVPQMPRDIVVPDGQEGRSSAPAPAPVSNVQQVINHQGGSDFDTARKEFLDYLKAEHTYEYMYMGDCKITWQDQTVWCIMPNSFANSTDDIKDNAIIVTNLLRICQKHEPSLIHAKIVAQKDYESLSSASEQPQAPSSEQQPPEWVRNMKEAAEKSGVPIIEVNNM